MRLFDIFRLGSNSNSSARAKAGQTKEAESKYLIELGTVSEECGQFTEALQHYDAALRLTPDLGQGHFKRGNVLLELGDLDGAVEAFRAALKYKPDSAAAHYNIGNALIRLNKDEAAVAEYEQALLLKPDFADASLARGVALERLEQPDSAIQSYLQTLTIRPDYPEANFNLGNLYLETGRREDAIICFRRAIEINPSYAAAHFCLGLALSDGGKLESAADSYCKAIEINTNYVKAYNNLGAIMEKLGQLDLAITNYREALKIAPEMPELHNNLGVALKKTGKTDEAIASFSESVARDPNFSEGFYNLGVTHQEEGRIAEAIKYYRKALELDCNRPDAANNLAVALQETGQLQAAVSTYRNLLNNHPGNAPSHNKLAAQSHNNLASALADLGDLDAAAASYRDALCLDPDHLIALSNLLLTDNFRSDHSPSKLLEEAKRFGEIAASKARPFNHWQAIPDAACPLRIGLLSADLRQHPVGYFLEGVLKAFTPQALKKIEFHAYFNNKSSDAISERIKACCSRWQVVTDDSDELLAQRIHRDAINILIDLSGHTGRNRLPVFAWKPAPVQVTWLGYFATTGVAAMDYLIADPWTLPESEEVNFTETIWRMPETRLCFTPPDIEVSVKSLPALENNYVTFACFNNLAKVNNEVIAVWARILNAAPSSKLFLKARQLHELSGHRDITQRFAKYGISPERLVLEAHSPRENYLATYNRVDIALDPFPYTGGTTTAESLWMGVPVLTLSGKHFLGRQGVGILANAGLRDWIATDLNDYVTRAVSHANNLERLASLRAGLRQQVLASPIFDAQRFARHFESVLLGMWEKWCRTQVERPSEQAPPLSSVK